MNHPDQRELWVGDESLPPVVVFSEALIEDGSREEVAEGAGLFGLFLEAEVGATEPQLKSLMDVIAPGFMSD